MKRYIVHCKYCGKTKTTQHHGLANNNICDSCKSRLSDVRWFRDKLEPLRKIYEERKKNNASNNN